jgi:hypothetical protein
MARNNSRDLELSFKPYGKHRKGGRWFKIENGKPVYFGTGNGVSDRESYKLALNAYRIHQGKQAEQIAVALFGTPPSHGNPQPRMSWTEIGRGLRTYETAVATAEPSAPQIAFEVPRLQSQLTFLTGKNSTQTTPLSELIDTFLADQRRHEERGRIIEKKRAAGEKVKAAKRETIGADYLESVEQWTERLRRRCVGGLPWDIRSRSIAKSNRHSVRRPAISGMLYQNLRLALSLICISRKARHEQYPSWHHRVGEYRPLPRRVSA